jgi:putative ABC transport system ATP-binding protein
MNRIIEAQNLWKTYRLGETKVNALRDLSIMVDRGDYIAIMGPSGSGKSTLLHLLGCLDTPTKGVIKFDGRDVSKLKDKELTEIRCTEIGFIFQTFNLMPILTALENVEIQLRLNGVKKPIRIERAKKVLELVGLGDRLNHLPNQLSGGERQRVAIARALVKNPKLLIADEPTGNLDSSTTSEIVKLFEKLNTLGQTIVVATHDIAVAKGCKKIMKIKDGMLIE